MKSCWWKGVYPGGGAPAIPDEVDEVDADYVVEGYGVGGLRQVVGRCEPICLNL